MMKKNTGLFIGIAAVLVIIVVAVIAMSGSKKSTSSTPTSPPSSSSNSSSSVAATAVNIKDYMFAPMVTTVKVGTKVTWTNQDSVHHNVVADTASADAPNGPLIGQGESYSFTFKKAGTYTFHCTPHPYMHGTVIVTP